MTYIVYRHRLAEPGIFPNATYAFRYVARQLGKRMYEVTCKEAMDAGYLITTPRDMRNAGRL